MYSFHSITPASVSTSVVERFFVVTGSLPEGVVLEDKPMPSIMQSVIVDLGASPQKAILPNGKPFSCAGDLIIGQFTKRYSSVLSGNLNSIGVQFAPTGMYRLFRKPMTGFANTIQYLKDHAPWHDTFRGMLDHAEPVADTVTKIEKFLQGQLLQEAGWSLSAVEQACTLMRNAPGDHSLFDIARMVGKSERNMQRYFLTYVGVSPKAFMRIARFNAVTRLIEQRQFSGWQDILIATGYCDAAHFSREFKMITGRTPTEYYKGKAEYERFFYGM